MKKNSKKIKKFKSGSNYIPARTYSIPRVLNSTQIDVDPPKPTMRAVIRNVQTGVSPAKPSSFWKRSVLPMALGLLGAGTVGAAGYYGGKKIRQMLHPTKSLQPTSVDDLVVQDDIFEKKKNKPGFFQRIKQKARDATNKVKNVIKDKRKQQQARKNVDLLEPDEDENYTFSEPQQAQKDLISYDVNDEGYNTIDL